MKNRTLDQKIKILTKIRGKLFCKLYLKKKTVIQTHLLALPAINWNSQQTVPMTLVTYTVRLETSKIGLKHSIVIVGHRIKFVNEERISIKKVTTKRFNFSAPFNTFIQTFLPAIRVGFFPVIGSIISL